MNKRLALVGTSMPAYKVLFRLVRDQEVPQHELAWDAAMDPAAISRLIRQMAKEGIVTTRVDPTDKRQRFVRLTAKGRELERALSPVVDAALAPYHGVLNEREQAQLLALLQKACDGVAAVAHVQEGQEAREQAPLAPRARTKATRSVKPQPQKRGRRSSSR